MKIKSKQASTDSHSLLKAVCTAEGKGVSPALWQLQTLMGEASQGEGPPSKHLDINELSVLDYPSSRGVAEYANTAAGQATGIFPTYMQVGWLFAHM